MTKKQESQESVEQTGVNGKSKKARHRSPNFPALSLEKAVDRAKELYDSFKLNSIPERAVHEKWRYAAFGSQGLLCVAALKAYGLIIIEGSGKQRKIAISETGRRIILNAADREGLLKEAALLPPISKEIWEHFDGFLPKKDEDLRSYLVVEKRFNEQSVARFISDFRDTIAFTKLDSGSISETEGQLPPMGEGLNTPQVKVQPLTPVTPSQVAPQFLDFIIPRKGQRLAILRLEFPVTKEDVEQITAWLDLMKNTLEDDRGNKS